MVTILNWYTITSACDTLVLLKKEFEKEKYLKRIENQLNPFFINKVYN